MIVYPPRMNMGFTILELIATMVLTGIILLFINAGILKWRGALGNYNQDIKRSAKINSSMTRLDNILSDSDVLSIKSNAVIFLRGGAIQLLKIDGASLTMNDHDILRSSEIDSICFKMPDISGSEKYIETPLEGRVDMYGCRIPPSDLLEIRYYPIGQKLPFLQIIELRSPKNL